MKNKIQFMSAYLLSMIPIIIITTKPGYGIQYLIIASSAGTNLMFYLHFLKNNSQQGLEKEVGSKETLSSNKSLDYSNKPTDTYNKEKFKSWTGPKEPGLRNDSQ